jgi:hypothetical protein
MVEESGLSPCLCFSHMQTPCELPRKRMQALTLQPVRTCTTLHTRTQTHTPAEQPLQLLPLQAGASPLCIRGSPPALPVWWGRTPLTTQVPGLCV